MSDLTNFAENALIDHFFRARQHSRPTSLVFHLFTAAPGEAGGGTKVTGGSYAGVTVTPSDTAFTATQGGTPAAASSGTSGQTANAADITFPAPTANWGVVTHMSVEDQSGNPLMYKALTEQKTINNGDQAPRFPAASFTATFA